LSTSARARPQRARQSGLTRPRSQVRILHGDGVSFGCWLDVAADTIAWHDLSSPDAGIASARHAPRAAGAALSTETPLLCMHGP